MNIKKLRFKWKVFAYLFSFCALLLIILWLFQIVFLDNFYTRVKIMEIRRSAIEIINNAGNENIAEIINDISDSSGIFVDITDLCGRSLLIPEDPQFQERRITAEIEALISLAQKNDGEIYEYASFPARIRGQWTTSDRRPSMQYLVYVKIADNRPDEQFAVIIRTVISPITTTVTTLRYQLYFISGIMLFLAVFLAIIIAKHVSKPIEEISQNAAALAKGNYNVQFNSTGFFEIVALSETLNTAASDLGQVESLRRELIANVSHDLRTPLSLIYSYAEMMNDFPGEITKEQTQTIIDETQRLTTLVNDMLDISKLENEIEKLNFSHFNLTKSICDTTERMNEFLKNEGFTINFFYEKEVHVYADRTKLDRAFYNLLINAVNYSDNSPVITVEQTISDSFVRISITDNGEGIAEEDLPFIWDRYYKSGKTHKRAVTGTGLGLSIVRKIIELHGGRHGVASQISKGSVFWFEIRLTD